MQSLGPTGGFQSFRLKPMLTNDLIAALLTALDSKLAATDTLALEDLELTQRLVQARIELEAIRMKLPRKWT
jgi:hypothetical protein